MNPFIFPGLKPPISNHWIIPGFSARLKPTNHRIKTIYRSVLIYFDADEHKHSSRKRELVQVRHWTLFLAVCAGFRTTVAADFFQKNHATTIHACKKILSEIQIYSKSQRDFEYFYRIYRFNPDSIQSVMVKKYVKSWKIKQLT